MLPYYNTLKCIKGLVDGIENAGLVSSALVAPHYIMETPGGAMLFVINNHSKPVVASHMSDNGMVSISDKLVLVSMEQGSVVTDARPRAMPDGESFGLLSCLFEKRY